MDETKEIVKKYWPYLVGGLIALWLLLKMSGSSSSSSDAAYAAYLQQQTAAGTAAAQIGLQQQSLDQSNALATATLNAQQQATQGQQQIDYLNAQGNIAQSVAGAAASLVGALYQPTVAAQVSAASENQTALAAASAVAAAGFNAQSTLSANGSNAVQSVASGLQTFGNIKAPASNFQSLLGTLGSVANTGILAATRPGVGSSSFGFSNFL